MIRKFKVVAATCIVQYIILNVYTVCVMSQSFVVVERRPHLRPLYFLLWNKSGVDKLRPVGRIRPADQFNPVRQIFGTFFKMQVYKQLWKFKPLN